MSPELATIASQIGVGIVLWILLRQTMSRLDIVTDKLISILENQNRMLGQSQDNGVPPVSKTGQRD